MRASSKITGTAPLLERQSRRVHQMERFAGSWSRDPFRAVGCKRCNYVLQCPGNAAGTPFLPQQSIEEEGAPAETAFPAGISRFADDISGKAPTSTTTAPTSREGWCSTLSGVGPHFASWLPFLSFHSHFLLPGTIRITYIPPESRSRLSLN